MASERDHKKAIRRVHSCVEAPTPATAMAISTNLPTVLFSNLMRQTQYSLGDDDDLGHCSEWKQRTSQKDDSRPEGTDPLCVDNSDLQRVVSDSIVESDGEDSD